MPDLLLPRQLPSVARACDWIEAALGDARWPAGDVTRAVLCVSECVSNAVEHGGPHTQPLRVSYALRPDALTVWVMDGGGGPSIGQLQAPALPADPLATGGRGLFILHRLTDEVAVDANGGVRMTIRTPS